MQGGPARPSGKARVTEVSVTSFWGGKVTKMGRQWEEPSLQWGKQENEGTEAELLGYQGLGGGGRLTHGRPWEAEECLGQLERADCDSSLQTEVLCGCKLWTNLPRACTALVHLASLVSTTRRPDLTIKVAETPAQICHNLSESLFSDGGGRGVGAGIWRTCAMKAKK